MFLEPKGFYDFDSQKPGYQEPHFTFSLTIRSDKPNKLGEKKEKKKKRDAHLEK